jgi:hypothetical protein
MFCAFLFQWTFMVLLVVIKIIYAKYTAKWYCYLQCSIVKNVLILLKVVLCCYEVLYFILINGCCIIYFCTEKLEGIKIEVPEVTQTEVGQKQKLHVILEEINHILPNAWNNQKWTVDGKVHVNYYVYVCRLLVYSIRRIPLGQRFDSWVCLLSHI